MNRDITEKPLTERQARIIMVADIPGTAAELSVRHGSVSGYVIGCFARQSPLFAVQSRKANHIAIWQLTELGEQLRAEIAATQDQARA